MWQVTPFLEISGLRTPAVVPASEAKNSVRVVSIRMSGNTAGLKPCPKIALHRSKVDRYHDIVAYSMVGWMRNRNRNNSPWNVAHGFTHAGPSDKSECGFCGFGKVPWPF